MINKFRNFYLLLLYFFFLISCEKRAPDWYINPKIDKSNLHAMGLSSASFSDAKRKALVDLISQIKIQITSKANSTTQKNDKKILKNFDQIISTQVDNLEINNYEVENQTYDGETYYVLISLNKNNFINFLKRDIDSKIKEVKDNFEEIKDKPIEVKMLNLNSLEKKIEAIIEKDLILRILDNGHYNIYQSNILEFKKKLKTIKYNIPFFINSNDSRIKDIFSKILLQNNYQISAKYQENKTLTLDIQSNFEEKIIFDSFNIKLNLECTFKGEEGVFKMSTIEKSSTSSLSFDQARVNLYKNLEETIQDLILNFDK